MAEVRTEELKKLLNKVNNRVDEKADTLKNEISVLVAEAFNDGYFNGVDVASAEFRVEIEKTYDAGLNTAWEYARKIILDVTSGGLDYETLNNIFGTGIGGKIFKNNTASEAIEKIRKYEKYRTGCRRICDELRGCSCDKKGGNYSS